MSLGWAGPGNALNSHIKSHKGRGGLGLTKPLLVAHKKNTFGIGKKVHQPASGNDWWLKGFEKALQGVGTDGAKSGSEATSGTATPAAESTSGYVGKHSGLYGFFVRGEQMEGTLDGDETRNQETSAIIEKAQKKSKSKKRKSEAINEDTTTSLDADESASRSKKTKKTKGQDPAQDFAQISAFLEIRDKERKKNKRRSKDDPATEFQQIGAFLDVRDDVDPALEKRKRKKKVKDRLDSNGGGHTVDDLDDPQPEDQDAEAEAARKERRRRRKEEKRKRREEEEGQIPKTIESHWGNLVKGSNTESIAEGASERGKIPRQVKPSVQEDERQKRLHQMAQENKKLYDSKRPQKRVMASSRIL